MEPKRAMILILANFRHLLRVTEATSRFPELRDVIERVGEGRHDELPCGVFE